MPARPAFLAMLSFLFLASGSALPHVSAYAGHANDSGAPSTCSAPYVSASGATQVTICPPSVVSGQAMQFDVRSIPSAAVSVHLFYRDGTQGQASDTTDVQGLATIPITVSYNPLYRYASARFQVTVVKQGGNDIVRGTFRVAQVAAVARLRIKPAGAPDWCADGQTCTVKNGQSVTIRVDTVPSAQVQAGIAFPDGQDEPCVGNAQTGSSGAFADNTGAYVCTLPVYLGTKKGKHITSVVVVATVTSDATTIPLRQVLWLAPG